MCKNGERMKFVADLHIHSHFSLATSSKSVIPQLDVWARKKGISVVGTGDSVHPGWLSEIKPQLVSCGNGLFQLKKEYRSTEDTTRATTSVFFLLTTEISCIYKRDGKVRKVHNIVMAPDFGTFEAIQQKLSTLGNITSDGRPILGLDSRVLLDIILSINPDACLIPAHIWTPWFSVLGSKSGFDTISECYGDLAEALFAVETGLSSDPLMNRRCSFLDKYTMVSNSDAHSPEKLGREANIFSTDCSYSGIIDALKKPSKGFLGTIEYFPEEGKYHLDGHRSCSICFEPQDTIHYKGICPVCKKPLTIGVLNRVNELADRKNGRQSPSLLPFYSLTGLKSIIAERYSMREQSKKIEYHYNTLIKAYGTEISILLEVPPEDLAHYDTRLSEGIFRLRAGKVLLTGGYDGVFGKVKVYN
jgi:uncharacterized protein (TIGR00375 family)